MHSLRRKKEYTFSEPKVQLISFVSHKEEELPLISYKENIEKLMMEDLGNCSKINSTNSQEALLEKLEEMRNKEIGNQILGKNLLICSEPSTAKSPLEAQPNISSQQCKDLIDHQKSDSKEIDDPFFIRNSIKTVVLIKNRNYRRLGLTLLGGKDLPDGPKGIFVKDIEEGGLADKNGMLKVSDQLISVNGISVENVSLRKAREIIGKLKSGPIVLQVQERPI